MRTVFRSVFDGLCAVSSSLLLAALLVIGASPRGALAAATQAPPPASVAGPKPPDLMDGAQILHALHRLSVVGSVLYVGAHPDDENTALMTWLTRARGLRVGYFSLTRGDGGQNLLGPEIGEALGVIRTQELLAARRLDGAEQYFGTEVDFGFSKRADETIEIWGHDRALADMVWGIRRFQPDVIVTRFHPDSTSGHGHHRASAQLAEEAFVAAADPTRFPEQLQWAPVWKARRLLWNTFSPIGTVSDPGKPGAVTVDIGTYDPILGRAYTEMAGLSRSTHKTQGFGAAERRGSILNSLLLRQGDPVSKDFMDGIATDWSRVRGGAAVGSLLRDAERSFDPRRPSAILPTLLKARAAMASLPGDPLIEAKRRELMEVIRSCSGLWIEAIAGAPTVVPGSKLAVAVTVLNRSDAPLRLESVSLPFGASGIVDSAAARLERNKPAVVRGQVSLPEDFPITQPYWLRAPGTPGAFTVEDPALLGLPENPPALTARVALRSGAETLVYDTPVVWRWTDQVLAERFRSLDVAPPVTCRFEESAYLFTDASPREVRVVVRSTDSSRAGIARLKLPTGWKCEPAEAQFSLKLPESEQPLRFRVTPGAGPASSTMTAEVVTGGRTYSRSYQRVDYPHIPVQIFYPPAQAKLVRTDARIAAAQVGYLAGSGDQTADALRQLGFQVTLLSDDDLESADLSRFSTIVAGVRAYNTRARLRTVQPRLLDWVSRGGRLVVQYQRVLPALNDQLGPWPLALSNDRVTDEKAEMRFLDPASPLLTRPNKITASDFLGWVQERGLNYPSAWDKRYETVLSANDPGESAEDGGVLIARSGRGQFIYTGLALFRQLPAGVPGAWRLFANLVSPEPPRPARVSSSGASAE